MPLSLTSVLCIRLTISDMMIREIEFQLVAGWKQIL